MTIFNKTRNSFIAVMLSLVISPYDTYDKMINHEKSRFSIFIAFLFFSILIFPSMLCRAFAKKPIYVEGFLEILVLVLALTFLFYVIFLKIILMLFRYKCSFYKTFTGSCYLFAYLSVALLVSYGLNYSLDYDYFRLTFMDGINETPSKYYLGYFKLFKIVTAIFTIVNLVSLARALTRSSFSLALCFAAVSITLFYLALIFGITFSEYFIENSKNIFFQFLHAPRSLIII